MPSTVGASCQRRAAQLIAARKEPLARNMIDMTCFIAGQESIYVDFSGRLGRAQIDTPGV